MSDHSSISSSPSIGESSLGLPSIDFSSGSSVSSGSPSNNEKISSIQNQLNSMRQKLSETRSRLQQSPLLLSKASTKPESQHNNYNDLTQNNSVLNHQDNSNSNIPIIDDNNSTQQNPPPLTKLSLSSSSSSSYHIAVEDILDVSDTNSISNPEEVSNCIDAVPQSTNDENQIFPQSSKSKEMLDTSLETHRAQNPSTASNHDNFHQRQLSSSGSLISDITNDEMMSLEEITSNHSNKHSTPDESLLVRRSQNRLDRISRVHDNVITMQTENYYLKNINMKLLMQLDSLMREHKELQQTALSSKSFPIPEKIKSDANDHDSQEVDMNQDDICLSPSSDLQKDCTFNSLPSSESYEVDDLPNDLSTGVLSTTTKKKKTIFPSALTTTSSSVISFSSATSRSWRNHLERQREEYNMTKRKLEEKRVKCRELLIAVQNEQKLKNSKVLCVSCQKSLNKLSSSDEHQQHFVVINKLKQKEEEVEQLNLKNQYLADKYELVHKSLQESRLLHNEDKEIMHQLEMESHRLRATISTVERESALKSKTIESLERQLDDMKMTMEDMNDLHQIEKGELHQYCEELKQEADRLVLWMKANNDQAIISETKSLTKSEEDALLEEIYEDRKMWLNAKNDLDRHIKALAEYEDLPQQQNSVDNQINKVISLEVRDVTHSRDSSSLSDSS